MWYSKEPRRTTNMNLEILQQICKKCGTELVERTEDGIKSYELDGYVIDPTEEPVLIRGLVERPHPTNTKWQISEIIHDYGDRDTPPSSDLKEIEQVDSLGQAVQRVLELIAINTIEMHFVNAWEDEQAQRVDELLEDYFG